MDSNIIWLIGVYFFARLGYLLIVSALPFSKPFAVDDYVIEFGKVFGVAQLSSTEVLCGGEVRDVFMVCIHFNLVQASFQVVSKFLEGIEDC